MTPVERVHAALRARLASGDVPGVGPHDLSVSEVETLFRAQALARALDRTSRDMQAAGQGFYTIGSSGHEGMAAVAAASRTTDPAFLHYRDAAFQIVRARAAGQDWPEIAEGFLKSFACAVDDPVSGGRHKVLGSKALAIPPQTSTIASHLPKAVGAAYALGLARRAPPPDPVWPRDAIAIASFGDASVNHSTAQGAFNAAGWAVARGADLPLLMVCEDNRIGISVPAPEGWTEAVLRARPGIGYVAADGCDLAAAAAAAREAADRVRATRRPVVLHLDVVRLYGHAGADVAEAYLDRAAIAADEARDPLLRSAALLPPGRAAAIYDKTCAMVEDIARAAPGWRRLRTADEVAASIIPPPRDRPAPNRPDPAARRARHGGTLPEDDAPQPMNRQIARALVDLMETYPEVCIFGEDVGRKGGVYGITRGLQAAFGPARVTDTLLDEQSILGLAIGMAQAGFLPIPEIQFLAYLHNAEDQLRGEAATLPFFSNGGFDNPMVVRVPGLGYQKGFGGHFHNDNSLGVLRDIPGLIVACPARGDEAAMMLRECVRLARTERRVVVFVEPIALYAARDVMDGDGGWTTAYPPPDRRIGFGDVGVSGAGADLAIVTYGNGRLLAERAAQALRAEGVALRIVDLRWLVPLPEPSLRDAVAGCGAVLVVDECRRSGNVSEGVMTAFAEAGLTRCARLTATDSFIATGPAHAATLPSVAGIVAAAQALLAR